MSYNLLMLRIENLSYNIAEENSEKEILNNVTFKFEKNKTYVITGPNGSGKSTLVKNIMGILSSTSGRIFWMRKI